MDEAAKTISSTGSSVASDSCAVLLVAGMSLPAAELLEQAVRVTAMVSESRMESFLLLILTTPYLSAVIAGGAIAAAHEASPCCNGTVSCKYAEAAVA
jgi:hypothetical protein